MQLINADAKFPIAAHTTKSLLEIKKTNKN